MMTSWVRHYEVHDNTIHRGVGLASIRTRFEIHEQDDGPTLSDKPEKLHHVRRTEGTPRAHLLTSETI